MMRLNNKGITTIEVIICFVLVVTITTSMYGTVASYNQKRIIEQYKEEIYTYKNLLTKEIQDDFIKIGITHAEYKKAVSGAKTTHTVDCIMKDGSRRKLVIEQQFSKSDYHVEGSSDVDDYYMIKYGDPDDLIEYPIPDLGESRLIEKEGTFVSDPKGKIVKDLSINNVLIKISSNNVLDIYIGFYHPELTTRYGIQIVCPIDYTSGTDATDSFNLY